MRSEEEAIYIMKEYVLSRIVQALFLILGALTFSFLLFRVLPGDPAVAISGDPRLPIKTRQLLNQMFGLDKPIHEQFLIFLFNAFTGNLGISFQYKQPVTQILYYRFLNSVILLIPATVLSILLGIAMGIVACLYEGGLLDKAISLIASSLWATPSFWGGMIMIYLFAINLRLFPTGGMVGYGTTHIDWNNLNEVCYHAFLPVLTYGIIYSGQYTLILRSNLRSVLAEDFMQLVRAKGFTPFKALTKHALKNAMLPLITLIGLNFGYIILGSITIETVFTWPGLGRLLFEAVFYKDYPVLQGIFLFFTVVMILITVIIDILYHYIDPRVRVK